jgi:hypothetical protein
MSKGVTVRHLIATFLCLVSLNAAANWTTTSTGVESDKPWTKYVDLGVMERHGKDWFTLWTLLDFPKGRESNWLYGTQLDSNQPWSAVMLEKYYCSTRLVQIIYTQTFAGMLGTGKSLSLQNETQTPRPIVPQSDHDRTLKLHCLK